METQKGRLQLRDNDILVIARIADEGALGPADGGFRTWQVAREFIMADTRQGIAELQQRQPARHALVLVEIRLVVRAAPVDIVEVEARGAEIGQRVGIILFDQRTGGIECEIMVDELAEISVAGRHAHILLRIRLVLAHRVRLLRRSHFCAKLAQRIAGMDGRRQGPEYPAETAFEHRRAAGERGTADAAVGWHFFFRGDFSGFHGRVSFN